MMQVNKPGILYFLRYVYLLVWVVLPWLQIEAKPSAVDKTIRSEEDPLFIDEDVLQIKVVADYQKLLRDRGDEREYHPATLYYTDTKGDTVAMNLKVMVRGNRRRDPSVCRFPPLMLNFVRKTSSNTIFRHVNKVKLVTHCVGEEYVLREYLVYKVYNIITDHSFRVRLCQVEYVDVQGKRRSELRYAFMIEDDKDVARRSKGKLMKKDIVVRMDRTDERAMAKLAIFQYMIGNTDWSVPFRHNIKLISLDSLAAPIPVPYDFDYAGIVAAPYASPPPELGISSVKQRLYRGYSFPENIFAEVINTFNSYKTPIYAVYRQCEPLSKSSRKQSLKYLDSFYKMINKPKKFKRKIVQVGERNQKKLVVVKGLE